MKIVFMGTPDFAVGILKALIETGHTISCVVTQPDRPKGRGRGVQFPPVKECALEHQIPVLQPIKIRTPEAVAELARYEADLFVVAAFGQILSSEILHMPKYGCINVHASLLPRYRGAAPIQWAIINGEEVSGVTIMQMNEGLDTGDMLAKTVVPIAPEETGDSLHDKLMAAGAALLTETIPGIVNGSLTPEQQKEEDSCYARMLQKSLGKIDWEMDGAYIERLIRGLNSWPGCYTVFRGKTLKIWEASLTWPEDAGEELVNAESEADSEEKVGKALEGTKEAVNAEDIKSAGVIQKVTKDTIEVQTGRGNLILKSVQPEGKKRMLVKDFLLGYPVSAGERLGE